MSMMLTKTESKEMKNESFRRQTSLLSTYEDQWVDMYKGKTWKHNLLYKLICTSVCQEILKCITYLSSCFFIRKGRPNVAKISNYGPITITVFYR